jgi:GxxExxY protein
VHLPVVYRDLVLPASYRVDFIVENCLLVEIKCVEKFFRSTRHRCCPTSG